MCTIQKCLVVKLGNRLNSYSDYQKDFWSICTHELDVCMHTYIHQAQASWEFWLPLLMRFCFMIVTLNFLFVIPYFLYWKPCCWTHLIKEKCLLIVALQGEIMMSRLGFQRMLQKPTSETHFWQWITIMQQHPWLWCSPVATHRFAKCWGSYTEEP